jgi:F0F1-type ATP synthase epsilon subunit
VSSFPLLNLKILSPDGINFEKRDLQEVVVPLADGGSIGIKPGHASLIAETVRGAIRYRTELEQDSIEVLPGVLDIRDNTVIILSAGKVSQQTSVVSEAESRNFERLMQTLISKIQSEEESNSLQSYHD